MKNRLPFRYMAITEQSVCPEPIPRRINRLFEIGVPAVQLRDKTRNDRRRFNWLRSIEPGHRTLLVNGRWDLAVLSGADGVHQPGDGLPIDVMESLGDTQFLYGVSTHSLEEVRRAETAGADYVTFGPIFPTPSKPQLDEAEVPGLEGLSEVTDEASLPVLALGGVTPDRLKACLDAGAYGAAGIRMLLKPENPVKNWSTIRTILDNTVGRT